ncbi:RDD family protein [Salinibacterium sp. SYSU T00001]|uniref:RDD family protein n=1 Tax=Homoserinimonas sedimenticola TaxID=2986805 RepID=UPI0022368FFB|nr:RDD family protein [Salinibacterium sedimenticola]MCW4384999.1 RDD family protein [Salinibacterium sedimenticola]
MSRDSAAASVAVVPPAEEELITGEAVALFLRPADFILRAAGAIIDWVAYLLIFFGVLLVISSPIVTTFFDEATLTAITVVMLVICVVGIPTTVETITQGRSLGKLAIGARIVRDDGGSISFRHALIRSLVGVVELFMTMGGIATITAILNPRSKRLGDLLAGTYSQHERVAKETPPVYGVPVELSDWALTADVARMPGALSQRISQFLRHAAGHAELSRRRIAEDLAAEASRYVSPVPECDPETFLAGVSAVRREREYRAHRGEQERIAALEPVLSGLPHGFPDR